MSKLEVFPQLATSCCPGAVSSSCCPGPAADPNMALSELLLSVRRHLGSQISIEVMDYSDPALRAQAAARLCSYLEARGMRRAAKLGEMVLSNATPAIAVDGQLRFVATVPGLEELCAALGGETASI